MEAHIVVRKAVQMLHDAVGVDMMQHLFAQLAVRRVNGDIQRAGFALDHAIDLAGRQVRQCDEIARHPEISRQSSSRTYRLGRMPGGICSIKQNMQWLAQVFWAAHQRGFERTARAIPP